MYALDYETGPYNPELKVQPNAYGLEPYRKEFYLKFFCVVGPNGYRKVFHKDDTNFFNDVIAELRFLSGKVVWAHNAVFDICCSMTLLSDGDMFAIKWRDTALLAKWVENSQAAEFNSYSLKDCVARHLPEELNFVKMKSAATNDVAYWRERVLEDTRVTLKLAETLLAKLPVEQTRGFVIEQACLVPLAQSTMRGISVDEDSIDYISLNFGIKITKLCKELGVRADVIGSPAKLGKLIFDDYGYAPISFTPTGKISTRAGDIKMIIYQNQDDKRLKLIAEIKSLLTVRNKYMSSFQEAIEYLGEPVLRPRAKLFNSYTGRATYSSKLQKKFPIAIAFHQLPRKYKEVKKVMVAPEGYRILYGDFNSQEIRLMAHFSGDETMTNALNNNMDLHAIMAESVFGTAYATIIANKETDPEIKNIRDGGKMINLSSQYRIGSKTFAVKAFEQYDKVITQREATHYLTSYKRTFKRVPEYWTKAIHKAQVNKYAETISKRRYYLSKMDWTGESSAINTPIQGSGADLLEVVIASVGKQFNELIFQLTVHDSVSWLIPDELDPKEVIDFINNINYSEIYGIDFKVTFPLDFAIGKNFAELESIK